MKIEIQNGSACGRIAAIASKSAAHRLMICAAFADKPTKIRCEQTNRDIEATADCLVSLGATIKREAPYYIVHPIKKPLCNTTLNCSESGSTLRFLVPVVSSLGTNSLFSMAGRLPERPLSPLREELEAHGVTFSPIGSNPLAVCGSLSGESFEIVGNVSSQFISGLLFALAIRPFTSSIKIIGAIESAPYIDMTLDALATFGIKVDKNENILTVHGRQELISPDTLNVEGDWSNAAFPLAAGAIGKSSVSLFGLLPNSRQGDREVVDILRRFGAKIEFDGKTYTASGGKLCGIDINASQIPDLVPILATVASIAEGETRIYGASRLRIKESDRIMSTAAMLRSLGADVSETEDGLIIKGKRKLRGGTVSSFNDHRIAMSAAIAASVCSSPVIIDGAEATNKSYPDFWRDLNSLKITHRIL